jgi:hypothetical protein
MSANNHYQQNNLVQHKSVHEIHQYPTSTAQMISNSLNLANDYYYDPDIQIHYDSNCNNTQSGPSHHVITNSNLLRQNQQHIPLQFRQDITGAATRYNYSKIKNNEK